MSDIFISYSREDRAKAQQLAELLEQNQWSVWWDRKTAPGKRFSQVIADELSTAKSVVVLWSQFSILSDWVKDEAQEAASRGILIPLLIENVTIPFGFRQFQAANLSDWDGSASHIELKGALDEISKLVSKPVIAAHSALPRTRLLRFTPRRAAITAVVSIVLLIAILIGYKQYLKIGGSTPRRQPDTTEGNTAKERANDRARQLTQEGMSQADGGNHKAAILSYNDAISAKPDYVDAYLYRGLAFVAISENESAIKDFTKLLELPEGDYRRKNAVEYIKNIQSPPSTQELNTQSSTPLGSQVADMFDNDKATRIAATTKLIIERKQDRKVVPLTISVVRRKLAEPDARKKSNTSSGVINALVLFENIDPTILRIHKRELSEMLELVKGGGGQTNEHIGKVRARLSG